MGRVRLGTTDLNEYEGRKIRFGYLPFRTNASTLPITPKRSSSCDVGTSSYRYHTTTYSPASVSTNRRTNDTIFMASMTATAGSDVVQSGRPIFDDFFQHLWPYIGNNTANVVFQMVKCLWLIRIDQ
ncbi:hypothetical protein TNCV_277411 [Trichonephila clavipes]|uniref:Uncharacterized protein n=1 Tax=Trichonephila clavipes TaxID=2585209 RepID=A0A8X6VH62_TRICX|nr:hypothetical protein TNCV_277411 [Trichonephila clavipes]